MILYMAVSEDKYELPIAVAASAYELGQIIGVKTNTIWTHISLARSGKIKKQRYFRIEIEEDPKHEKC